MDTEPGRLTPEEMALLAPETDRSDTLACPRCGASGSLDFGLREDAEQVLTVKCAACGAEGEMVLSDDLNPTIA